MDEQQLEIMEKIMRAFRLSRNSDKQAVSQTATLFDGIMGDVSQYCINDLDLFKFKTCTTFGSLNTEIFDTFQWCDDVEEIEIKDDNVILAEEIFVLPPIFKIKEDGED